ncbi:MAG: hypothetical protein ACOYW4_00585 [Bacillota bacterium]
MRAKVKFLFSVACLAAVVLGISASALAGWSWCTSGCPPGLHDNDHAKAYEATDRNGHIDLRKVNPQQGNTEHTADRNPHV